MIDTPGTLDNTDVLTTVLDRADFAIVPMNPEALNVQPLKRTIEEHIVPRAVPYRILLNKIDRRRAGQLEDWEALVDNGLKMPRFNHHIRMSAAVADAPLDGKVVTQYTDTRQNQAAIFDYSSVGLELTSIWANEGN
jgi:chromosome partitioning protein